MSDPGIEFTYSPQFKKDLKKLSKKYRSLPDDLENLKSVLLVAHFTEGLECKSFGMFPVSHKAIPDGFFVAKRFACTSLKGSGSRSGFRVVYQLDNDSFKFCFIELFHKSDKAVPDFARLKENNPRVEGDPIFLEESTVYNF